MAATSKKLFTPHSIMIALLLLLALPWECTNRNRAAVTPTNVVGYAEPGWLMYEKPTEGFRVALPARWKPISMEPGQLETSVKRVTKDPPTIASLTEFARNRFDAGVNFLAIDSGGTAVIQLSWRHQESPAINIDSLAELWSNNISAGGTQLQGPVLHTAVSLPIGEAQKIRYVTNETSTTQFLVHRGNEVYIVTLGTSPEQAAAYDSVFTKIGRSLRSSQ